MAIDGVDNCIAVLRDIESGRIHKCFIEMSACVGSCIGGPVMEKFHSYPAKDYVTVTHFAGSKDFPVMQPDSIALQKERCLQLSSVLRCLPKVKSKRFCFKWERSNLPMN